MGSESLQPLLPSQPAIGGAQRSPAQLAASRVVESLDYEPVQNKLYYDRVRQAHSKRHFYGYSGLTLAKFVVTICTGVGTGLIAFSLLKTTLHLLDWKNGVVQGLVADSEPDTNALLYAWAFHVAYTVSLAILAAILVQFWAPAAAGAGVTLVMAYLNGNHVPHLLELKTLITKFVGTLCGVAGGMAMGPEGPMVHLGACMASVVAHAHCEWVRRLPFCGCLPARSSKRLPLRPPALPGSAGDRPALPPAEQEERVQRGAEAEDMESDAGSEDVENPAEGGQAVCTLWDELFSDVEHREFIAAGSACGISTAFGAPIGGVLFSMEEACSFWSKKVAWRCLLSCMFAAFTIGQLSAEGESSGMLQFTGIKPLQNTDWLMQLPLMALAASIAGFFGAYFNTLRRWLWKIRASRRKPMLRMLEVVAVGLVTITWAFATSVYLGHCSPRPESWSHEFGPNFGLRWLCEQHEHNDLATMFFSLPDKTLRSMFSVGVDKAAHASEDSHYSLPSLLIFSVSWLMLMALGSGIAVPGGLFMPSLMVGSSFGLAFGLIIRQLLPGQQWLIQPGLYALICATAALGGVFRAALSLVVIMVEGTRGIDFMLAIILAVACSNGIAKLLHKDGVYESELERDGNVHFLRHEAPHSLQTKTASDIMASPVYGFTRVEKVSTVLYVLQNTSHNGFPVLARDPGLDGGADGGKHGQLLVARKPASWRGVVSGGRLEGMVLRSQLMVLLKHRMWCDASGKLLNQEHASNQETMEMRLENEMRLFFRKNHPQNRHMAMADGSLHTASRSLHRFASRSRIIRSPLPLPPPQPSDPSISAVTGQQVADADASPATSSGGAYDSNGSAEDAQGTEFGHRDAHQAVRFTGSPPDEDDVYVDLRPYMNQAPLTVRKETSAARCHHLFVTLGMRHLCVVDAFNCVVGVVTRKDLDAAAGRGVWRTTRITSLEELRRDMPGMLSNFSSRVLAALGRSSRFREGGEGQDLTRGYDQPSAGESSESPRL